MASDLNYTFLFYSSRSSTENKVQFFFSIQGRGFSASQQLSCNLLELKEKTTTTETKRYLKVFFVIFFS